eukprot:scaffold7243_cov394-Prasinococcus_capsulatus_cf.AAC.5
MAGGCGVARSAADPRTSRRTRKGPAQQALRSRGRMREDTRLLSSPPAATPNLVPPVGCIWPSSDHGLIDPR